VSNYGGSSFGRLDMRSALIRSVNTAFAQLITMVGVDAVKDMTDRLGIRPARLQRHRQPLHRARRARPGAVPHGDGGRLRRVRQPGHPHHAPRDLPRGRCARARDLPSSPNAQQVRPARDRRRDDRRHEGRGDERHGNPRAASPAGRSPARPGPPSRTATCGSSGRPRCCRPRCGWATPMSASCSAGRPVVRSPHPMWREFMELALAGHRTDAVPRRRPRSHRGAHGRGRADPRRAPAERDRGACRPSSRPGSFRG
jgi:hypothetical protein